MMKHAPVKCGKKLSTLNSGTLNLETPSIIIDYNRFVVYSL